MFTRRGFTLVEILVVIVVMGALLTILVGRVRPSGNQRVRAQARRLAFDLESARGRALSTRQMVRVQFDSSAGNYTGYLAPPGDSTFTMAAGEIANFATFRTTMLDADVRYGRAGVPAAPSDTASGTITLPSPQIDFDTRGMPRPLGTRGTIYLKNTKDTTAVAAVTITAAGAIRVAYFNGSTWQ